MATTTPNFGWAVPTSTDLVKDGAVAIETLGDSIDASLVDLKGGTTGQVLAKASNTDMDFTWSTDASGISPTIFAAKGDLLGASANDTPAVLSVGANGETLVADSSTSTGLRYQSSTAAGRNFTINGGFDIWQRGTTFAPNASIIYTADRWAAYRGGGGTGQTVSRQTGTGVNQYCARVARDSGTTATNAIQFSTSFETQNSIPLAGQTVVLSFYARAGANYSSASSALTVFSDTGTGTDQQILSGYTGSTRIISQTPTLTTSWQRFSYSAAVGSSTTEIGFGFSYNPVGTAGAADYFEVTGVQLEVGTVATAFSRAGATIQGELAACQRYYYRSKAPSAYSQIGVGPTPPATTSIIYMNVTTPVPMRTSVQSVDWGGNMGISDGVNVNTGISSIVPSGGNGGNFGSFATVAITMTSGVLTLYRPYYITDNGAGTTFLGISMEL
jgi:hypothetical protein